MEDNTSLSLTIWSILLLVGALHGGFLAVIFFRKGSTKNPDNLIFATFVGAISYIVTIQFLHEAQLIEYVPHLLATSTPVLYLLGPLFYLYIRSLLNEKFTVKWETVIHFMPFIICVLTIIPFYSNSAQFKIDYIRQSATGPVNLPYTRAIYYGLALIQNSLYWWLCHKQISAKKEQIKSFLDRWLTKANAVYGGFLIAYLTVFCLFLFTDFYLREARYTGYLLLSISVHLYGYLLLQESRPVIKVRNSRKYSGTNLEPEKIDAFKQQLLKLLEKEKPHLDSGLKLEDLAKRMNIPPHHLSQIINAGFDSNFNEFINTYRVEEAQRMLLSDHFHSYSLEGIAMESGFNNRTSFYRVFKKHTGTTPAQFKKAAVK